MARFDKLLRYFTTFNLHRNVLYERCKAPVNLVQTATLKSIAKEKLKSMNIPDPPRRPPAPYIRFVNQHRLIVKEQHPDWNLGKVTVQCAQDWRELDPLEKDRLSEVYKKELDVYLRDMEVYNKTLTEEQTEALRDAKLEKQAARQQRNIRKLHKEYNKPKRPMSSLLFYVKANMVMSTNKGKKLFDMISSCKDKWYAMSDEEKQTYVDMYVKDKARYDQEIVAWETKMIKEGNESLIRKGTQVITTKAAALPKSKRDEE